MTILITGARGKIAAATITQLLEAGEDVRAASRAAAEITPIDNVEIVDFDLSHPETITRALDGVNRVLLYSAHDGIEVFTEAVKNSEVEHVTLISSAAASYPDAAASPIGRTHLAAETALRTTGLGWTFLQPGMFATNTLWWATSIKESGNVRIAYPNSQVCPIHETDIADVAVAALTAPSSHDQQSYVLAGPESLSQAHQAQLIGEAIGRSLTIDELSHEQASAFWPAPVLEMLAENDGRPVPTGPTSEEITNKPARTFGQWALDHAEDFR